MSENSNSKLDKILEDLTDIKVVLTRHEAYHEANTRSLEEHILRTKQNELLIERLRQEDLDLEKSIEAKIDPINQHVVRVETAVKVVGITLTVIGAIIMGLYSLGILQKIF